MNKRFLLALALSSVAAWCQARPAGASHARNVSDTDKQIEMFEEQAKREPSDYSAYDALGAAFFQKARETGDVSYFDLAEQTLKRSLDFAPRDFRSADPQVHMALVCMGEHRFTDALAHAQEAIALGSGNLGALAVEGDAYTDLGRYEDAASAYNTVQTLGGLSSSPLALAYMIDSRKAYLQFLYGDSPQAIQLMHNAITAGLQIRAPSENLAWLYFELGERYFQSGDLPNAEHAYRSGIAVDPNHYRSIAGLARVRAAQGRLEQSVRLYQRSIAIIPFPVYVAELGDVYEKMGSTRRAHQAYDLVEYIAHLSQLQQVLANRELALFYADRGIRLPEALRSARRELEVRQDIYTWDTLAWVLYKDGQLREAASAVKNATRLNTKDSLLLFHAGMIAHSLGDDSDSRQFLSRALTANAHFHVFYADVARRTLDEISRSQNRYLRIRNVHN
ncbi:MAG TPA: tetratricopeptide repeat protein [Terriglobales bacterium]|nr:tetratricopeptide repeat protein [Terriglobales bacterium]